MKKQFTKVLAVLLTLCMLMGVMMIPTGAVEEEQSDGAITPDTSWYTTGTEEEETIPDAQSPAVYELSTAAQLLGFAALAQTRDFAGETIKLTKDIDLNPGWVATTTVASDGTVTLASAAANAWNEIPTFKGTFDGQGYTISGLYATRAFDSKVNKGAFVNELAEGTIKNVMFLNSLVVGASNTNYGSADMHVAGLVGDLNAGTIQTVYVDVDVWWNAGESNYHGTVAGIIGSIAAATCVVDDVVYAGAYGFVASDGKYSTALGGSVCYAGVAGPNVNSKYANELGDIANIGTYYKNNKQTGSSLSHGTGNRYVTAAAVYASNDSDCSQIADDLSTNCTHLYDNGSKIAWGVRNADYTYAERGWKKIYITDAPCDMAANKYYDGYHILPGTVVDMLVASAYVQDTTSSNITIDADTDWFGGEIIEPEEPKKKIYYLYDAADLLGLAELAQTHDFAGETIKLMADINLNPGWDATTVVASDKTVTLAVAPANVWTSIPVFKGTLDGNGHTISGIYSNTDFTVPATAVRACGGFISELINGEIRNLAVNNSLAFFESTTGQNGTTRIHIGGFISHVVDSSLTTLYVDMDTWVKFDWHFVLGGMIGAFGTKNDAYTGTVRDIVYAGTVGAIPKSGNVCSESGSRSDNMRIGGMIAANQSWDYTKAIGLTMHNLAFTGTAYKPGKASGDQLLCYTGSGNYNVGIGVDNAAFYNDATAWGATPNPSPTTLDSVATDVLGNKNAIGDTSDTYASAGWKSVTVADNAAYANGAGLETILLPGTVVDMLTSNTSNLYLQKGLDGTKIRFVGVVNILEEEFENFSKLGFDITMTYNGRTFTKTYTTSTVYTSLLANGTPVYASEYNGTYFYAIEITGLDAATAGDVVFTVDGITIHAGEDVTNVFGSAEFTYSAN